MERLTKRDESGLPHYPKCFDSACDGLGCKNPDTCDFALTVCERLAAYEDAEEQGLLVRMPCKVGDTVYDVNLPDEFAEVCEYTVQDVSVTQIQYEYDWFPLSDFGKTLFLNREAAEVALMEMTNKSVNDWSERR